MSVERRIVHVWWVDSVVEHGWSYRDEALAKAKPEVMDCTTVGYVLQDEETHLTLCMGQQPGSDSVLAMVQIPRSAIRDVTDLIDKP